MVDSIDLVDTFKVFQIADNIAELLRIINNKRHLNNITAIMRGLAAQALYADIQPGEQRGDLENRSRPIVRVDLYRGVEGAVGSDRPFDLNDPILLFIQVFHVGAVRSMHRNTPAPRDISNDRISR